MKTKLIRILPNQCLLAVVCRGRTCGIFAALVLLTGLNGGIAIGQGVDDSQGAEVLTRGPVHEAFAGIVSFNPEPGVIVKKAPPGAIEELPPEERPEGDNITWIPGYWAWDDERSDFLWISGTWRALPPGREWIAGYWAANPQGHQWISGYWADATVQETTYLPQPPATVESGPNVAAPSPDYGWTPGCWIWHQERYAWRPGYWAEGRTDWEWMPAHYVWTPRGYIFVDGYWDYGVTRRGVLFAPVYFGSGVYSRPGYSYSPFVAINLLAFVENLFLRPRYHHYYFGDYYDPRYERRGFYSPFAFQSNRYGYDPVYSHQRWQHRQDRNWERNFKTSYQYRRDHDSARPPRTWAAQRELKPDAQPSGPRMATSFDQLAKTKDSSLRFQPVPGKERRKLAQRNQLVQKSREERRALEAGPADAPSGKPRQEIKPTQVKLPKSAIVGKPASSLEKNQAPPKPHRASGPSSKVQPKPQGSDRKPEVDKTPPKRQQEPRKPEADKKVPKPMPGQDDAAPRGKVKPPEPKRQAVEPKGKPQPRQEPRQPDARKEQPKPERPQVPSRGKPEPPAPKRQAVEPPAKPRQEPQRPSTKPERKVQPQPQRAPKNEPAKTRQPSQPNTRDTQKPQQQTVRPHGKASSSTDKDDEKSSGKSSGKGPR